MLHVYVSSLQLAPPQRKRLDSCACSSAACSLAVAVQFDCYPLLLFHCRGSVTDGGEMDVDAGRACVLGNEAPYDCDLASHVPMCVLLFALHQQQAPTLLARGEVPLQPQPCSCCTQPGAVLQSLVLRDHAQQPVASVDLFAALALKSRCVACHEQQRDVAAVRAAEEQLLREQQGREQQQQVLPTPCITSPWRAAGQQHAAARTGAPTAVCLQHTQLSPGRSSLHDQQPLSSSIPHSVSGAQDSLGRIPPAARPTRSRQLPAARQTQSRQRRPQRPTVSPAAMAQGPEHEGPRPAASPSSDVQDKQQQQQGEGHVAAVSSEHAPGCSSCATALALVAQLLQQQQQQQQQQQARAGLDIQQQQQQQLPMLAGPGPAGGVSSAAVLVWELISLVAMRTVVGSAVSSLGAALSNTFSQAVAAAVAAPQLPPLATVEGGRRSEQERAGLQCSHTATAGNQQSQHGTGMHHPAATAAVSSGSNTPPGQLQVMKAELERGFEQLEGMMVVRHHDGSSSGSRGSNSGSRVSSRCSSGRRSGSRSSGSRRNCRRWSEVYGCSSSPHEGPPGTEQLPSGAAAELAQRSLPATESPLSRPASPGSICSSDGYGDDTFETPAASCCSSISSSCPSWRGVSLPA